MMLMPVAGRAQCAVVDEGRDVLGANDFFYPIGGVEQPHKSPQNRQAEKVIQPPCRGQAPA